MKRLWAHLDHPSHDVVKNSDLVEIALEHPEGQEVLDFDVVGNGKSSQPLIHEKPMVHIRRLHHPGVVGVGLQDDGPRNGAKVRTKGVSNSKQIQPLVPLSP
jgi:hypothetical protein